MLTGAELGKAIKIAIDKKLAKGSAKSRAEIAKHFDVKPPSIYTWTKHGTIAKDKLPKLWDYFSDVVGPEHWGMTSEQMPPPTKKSPFAEISFLKVNDSATPETFPLPKQILDSLDLKPNAARIIQAYSSSMHPTIKNGSWVIIDTTDKTPQDGKIYLIKDGERGEKLLLKRLIFEYNYLLEKSIWVMKCDNQDKKTFPDKFLPPVGTADIIGRAVWMENKL